MGLVGVASIGSAMIILFLLAGITVAVNHTVPTEYWAAAGALSGAMVGLFAPPPATRASLTRQAARLAAAGPDRGPASPTWASAEQRAPAAVGAAAGGFAGPAPAPPVVDITEPAPAGPGSAGPGTAGMSPAGYSARTERVEAITRMAATASSYDLRVIGLLAVGLGTLIAGIWLALTVGDHIPGTAYDTAVGNASTALIALGSAAGGALAGLLTPTPGQAGAAPG